MHVKTRCSSPSYINCQRSQHSETDRKYLLGAGNFLAYAGTYIWVLEYIPEQYRVYYNSWSMMIWTLGYPMLVCVCYYIHNWNYIFIATSLACAVTYIPVIILPDSPRFTMEFLKG